ncbi:MAG: PH domain-containing protein, partial [Dehalococcoidia bacterium]
LITRYSLSIMSKLPIRTTPLRAGTGQVFLPPNRRGAIVPTVAGGVALLLALVLVIRAVTLGISFAAFAMLLIALVLLVAGGLALYWAWACLRLRYELNHGVLSIEWGLSRYEVPVALLERAVRGRPTTHLRVDGLEWPGCHVGHAQVPRMGQVRVISLHGEPGEVLFLAGPEAAYAISVADSAAFIRALQDQMEQRAQIDAPRVVSHPLLRTLDWRDSSMIAALAASAILALIATGIIFARYAGFPDEIVRNFPEDTRVGSRTALLGIPLLAWLLLLANGAAGVRLATDRRTAAFTLLYGLTFLEALLVIAAATAV